jgi:hypothetical protein
MAPGVGKEGFEDPKFEEEKGEEEEDESGSFHEGSLAGGGGWAGGGEAREEMPAGSRHYKMGALKRRPYTEKARQEGPASEAAATKPKNAAKACATKRARYIVPSTQEWKTPAQALRRSG